MPAFAIDTSRAFAQAQRSDGFLHGSVLRDRKWTFWTMTLWTNEAAMRNYITTGDHRKAMPKLLEWCDEASIVHWTQEGEDAPTWEQADTRMRGEGRPSKVNSPSPRHIDLSYDAPRTTNATAIRPK